MKEAEFEDLLRRWGRVYGEQGRSVVQLEEHGEVYESGMVGGSLHPLAVAMEYAPGRNQTTVAVAYKRMIRVGEKPWSRDPVPGKETRHYRGALYFSGAEIGRIEPEVARVEKAAMDLYRINTLRGLVLRGQYCRLGDQREQVEWINGLGRGISVTLRAYRDELAHARTWMHGRLTFT